MLPYFIILAILLILSIIEQWIPISKNKILVLQITVLLILFAGFRANDVDRDYESYVNSFDLFGAPREYFKNFQDWAFFEPVFYLLPSFIKTYITVTSYSLATFVVFAIAGVTIKITAISKLSNFFFLSVLCYFCYFFMMHEMTQIRAGIASGILLLSVPLLYEKKYKSFFLIVLIASLFHYSALFIIPFVFLNRENPNELFYWILLATTSIFAFIDTSFIFYFLQFDLGPLTIRSNNYINYAQEGTLSVINKLNVVFLITTFSSIINLYFVNFLQRLNKYTIILGKIQIWGLFLFQFFSAIPGIAFRLTDLYTIVTIITFTNYCYLFKNRVIGFSIPVIIGIGVLLIDLYYSHLLQAYHIVTSF